MEFKSRPLKEILEINPRITLKKGTLARKIAMENVKENKKHIENYIFDEYKSGSKFQNEDTLVARITPCLENGKTAYVDILNKNEIAFGSTEFFVVRPKENLGDAQFIYYLMRTPVVRDTLIKSMTGTSGRQRAQRNSLLELSVSLPQYTDQIKIGSVLSNIDEKIRLNSKIITNLEELTQTLFKRWFVDFEFPNKDGDPYKSTGGDFIEAHIGMLPPQWEISTMDQVGSITGGATPSKKVDEFYTKHGISWITPKDLSNNKNKYIYAGETDISDLGLNKSSAKLMPKNTVLFSSRAPIGYIALAGKEVTTNQGFKSIVPDKGYSPYYIYFLLKEKLTTIEQSAGGSTFKEISGKGLKQIGIYLPPKAIVDKFHSSTKVYFEKIKSIELENKYLIELRDTLLPKLMSGEIELPNDLEVDEHAKLLQ